MYQENEDDWKILKEYKQELRVKLNEKSKHARKVARRAAANKPRIEEEIADLEERKEAASNPRAARSISHTIKDKQKLLADVEHDIKKAEEIQEQNLSDSERLKKEVEEIDKKIREIRTKRDEKKKVATKEKKDPVQKCPKKCRISDVKVVCSHNNRSMPIAPFEGETPEFHVVSGSSGTIKDTISVNFGGSCDQGKSQSAGDSTKNKEKIRTAGADQYCPRVRVDGSDGKTQVERPSVTKFDATTASSSINATPLGFLINNLVFGNKDDTTAYDMSFTSCQGGLPYKAKVVAHPQCSWNIEFTFGYKDSFDKHRLNILDKDENYDTIKSSGKWSSTIKASYGYDIHTEEIAVDLDFDTLLKELGKSWAPLKQLCEFFSPINGFIENALGCAKSEQDNYDKTHGDAKKAGKLDVEGKMSTVDVQWPNLKISGVYQRAEMGPPTYGMSGAGSFKVEFAPLIGITGKIDLIQYLLLTFGGPFGNFLRKVSNMSIGKREGDGEIDKSKSYVETNLALAFGATSDVSGSVGFDCTVEKGWHASAGGTGVSGFIGFILEGSAKVEGKIWRVKFGAGGDFKAADETGTKNSGIEVSRKPIVIDEQFSWVGAVEFNGLSILGAVYESVGAEGATDKNKSAKDTKGFAKITGKQEAKRTGKRLFLSKRPLWESDKIKKIGT